jgi:hypothetical protein
MSSEKKSMGAPVHAVVMRAGGPLVKDYGTHFLRDDTEIRKSAGCYEDQVEAYSLFCVEPYGRVEVFGGSREWAIQQADLAVKSA